MSIGFIISTASFLVPRVVAAVKAVQGFVTVVETEKDALAAILDAGTDVFQALGNPEHVTLAVRHRRRSTCSPSPPRRSCSPPSPRTATKRLWPTTPLSDFYRLRTKATRRASISRLRLAATTSRDSAPARNS